jgi:acetyl esterase
MPSEFLKCAADRKTFQALFYPISDTNFDSQSYMPYQEGYWLKLGAMRSFSNNYVHNNAIDREIAVSSLLASIGRLMDCHEHLQSEGLDVLHDQVLISYACRCFNHSN